VRQCVVGAGETAVPVTASIGLSRLQPGEPLDNQLNAADQMLYLAKSDGRDRIHSDSSITIG
jgi:PleD family two-component response regulator